jgi:prepilin-type N-terminal cleavage/methylation domain-containing protein
MSRSGFTLVEVLVALTLSAIALGTAVGIFASTQAAVISLESRSVHLARRGNGQTWMMEAFGSAYLDPQDDVTFEGLPDQMRFRSWLRARQGWGEDVELGISFESGALVGRSSRGALVTVADSLVSASWEYLEGLGEDAPWRDTWSSDRELPTAVRLRYARVAEGRERADTLLFLVGTPDG